jgi:putative endonuclease
MLNLFQHPSGCERCRCASHGKGAAMPKQPCVYLLASQRYGTIYTGVTSHRLARLYQHRNDQIPGFTSRYAVHLLVRYEWFATMPEAIAREKQLKRWHRPWKINLIESQNPDWVDLAPGPGMEPLPSPPRRHGW